MLALLSTVALAQPLVFATPLPPTPPAPPEALEAPAVPAPPVVPAAPEVPAVPHVPRPPRFLGDGEVQVDEPSGDLFGMGGAVRVNAEVGDNAFVMGGDVEVLAPVHGDLFAMGGQLTVDAPVHGDVYVTGGEVALGPRAAIDGHLYVAAGQVDLQGAVAGDAHVGSGQLTLDAPIHGDLSAEVGQLVLGDRAAVAGDVELVSPDVPARLQAVTGGEVSWEAPPEPQEHDGARVVVADPPAEEGWSVVSEVLWWGGFRMWGYLTKLTVGSVLLLLGGRALAGAGRTLVSDPARSLGAGFLVLCVLPVASTMALLTVIPFPLGLVGWALFAVLLYVAQLFAAQAAGDALLRRFRPDAWGSPILSLAVGLVPLVVLTSLPWFGPTAWLVATLFGAGALWLQLRTVAHA